VFVVRLASQKKGNCVRRAKNLPFDARTSTARASFANLHSPASAHK